MSEEESEGLGDTVEKIITKIGDVTKIEFIRRKKGCSGCRKRKEALNRAFPYKGKEASSGGCTDCDKKAAAKNQETKEPPCTDCDKKKEKKGGCGSCGK